MQRIEVWVSFVSLFVAGPVSIVQEDERETPLQMNRYSSARIRVQSLLIMKGTGCNE
jgi:hypothetical protein